MMKNNSMPGLLTSSKTDKEDAIALSFALAIVSGSPDGIIADTYWASRAIEFAIRHGVLAEGIDEKSCERMIGHIVNLCAFLREREGR